MDGTTREIGEARHQAGRGIPGILVRDSVGGRPGHLPDGWTSRNSPRVVPGTPITLAVVLLATGYMWAPALAHILTRVVTREGWKDTFLVPRLRRSWPHWIAAWVGPSVLILLGAALFYALFPGYFDASLSAVRAILREAESISGRPLPLSPWAFVIIHTVQAIVIAPVINGLFTFGEELGWRAYLQPKLMPLGARRAFILMGVIWGVWHWPVIAMGARLRIDTRGALAGSAGDGLVHVRGGDVPGLGDAARRERVACRDRPRRDQRDSADWDALRERQAEPAVGTGAGWRHLLLTLGARGALDIHEPTHPEEAQTLKRPK